MSEPIPPPSTPSPFDRPDTGPAPRGGGSDVRKPLLIGCGALLLLVFSAFALFVVYQDSIAAWVVEAMHDELEPRLPEDLPDDVRTRYDRAFEDAATAIRGGDYQPEDLQSVLQEVSRLIQESSSRLTVDEVERLAAALEEVPDD